MSDNDVMDDFRQLTWDEVAAMERAAAPPEDAEFSVEYDEQTGPAWDVWAITYPHREADARKYLVHERTHNGVYWYRDTRDEREYGMPEIELAEAHNEVLVSRQDRADHQRDVRKRLIRASIMLTALCFCLLPFVGHAFGWILLGLPVAIWLLKKVYGREPKLSYRKLAEVRFDEFESDAEIQERRVRRLGNLLIVLTVGLYLYLRNRR
jgi:hypothetical protein